MQEEEEQDFITHKCESHSSAPQQHPFGVIINQIKRISEHLITNYFNDLVCTVLEPIGNSQSSSALKQIYCIKLLKNQEKEYEEFYRCIYDKFMTKKDEVFGKDAEIHEIQNTTEVKEIVFKIYMELKKREWSSGQNIFFVQAISNLSEQNLYFFDKGLRDKKCTIIIPTFESVGGCFIGQSCEKYEYSFYDPKSLFCDFVFECVSKEKIKAYLPSQVLGLISDMDYYHLSYSENCRRFAYCVERALMIAPKERKFVDFADLITLIENSVKRRFHYYHGYQSAFDRILKVILSEKATYVIPDKYITLEITATRFGGGDFSEEDLIETIKSSLGKRLRNHPVYERYAGILSQELPQARAPLQKRKRTRYQMLDIRSENNITDKHRLEYQITRIIKEHTREIRVQAGWVSWQAINFQNRMRPAIPYHIVESLKRDQSYEQLLEEVLDSHSDSLTHYLGGAGKERLGEVIYRLKCLELCGVVDMGRKMIKPRVTNNYYEKAQFNNPA